VIGKRSYPITLSLWKETKKRAALPPDAVNRLDEVAENAGFL
jgi:hypothetical protein